MPRRIQTPEQKERQKRYLKAWHHANPGMKSEYSRKRRARLRSNPVVWAQHVAKAKARGRKPGKPMTADRRLARILYAREYRRTHPRTEEQKRCARVRAIARIARIAADPKLSAREKSINHLKAIRRRKNPGYAIKNAIQCRIYKVLKGTKNKASRTLILLGCTPSELRAHIESFFLPGMTWENRSLWHIDHIRPCASFDLTDPEQQRCCFHYSNLQPLWAADNMRKSAKWEGV